MIKQNIEISLPLLFEHFFVYDTKSTSKKKKNKQGLHQKKKKKPAQLRETIDIMISKMKSIYRMRENICKLST